MHVEEICNLILGLFDQAAFLSGIRPVGVRLWDVALLFKQMLKIVALLLDSN